MMIILAMMIDFCSVYLHGCSDDCITCLRRNIFNCFLRSFDWHGIIRMQEDKGKECSPQQKITMKHKYRASNWDVISPSTLRGHQSALSSNNISSR
jgi:hypothetical protein